MNVRRVLAVASKEWREILRDRIYFALAFLLPAMLMLIFGFGMTHDVERVPLVVVDYDRSPSSRDYTQHFTGSRYFDFRGYRSDVRQVERELVNGELRVAVVIPDRFHARLTEGRPAEVQLLLDGTFTIAIRTIQGYLEAITAEAGREAAVMALARQRGIPRERAESLAQPVRLETRYLYNEEVRSMWTIAPLLVMFILTWITPLLMGLSVVREKETGSIYNIYASTVTRAEFIAGKMLPTVAVCCVNAAVMWLLATRWFQAPFRGNLGVFALGTLFFVIASCGIGLLISLMVRTQQAALIVSLILGMMIASEYSGMQTPVADLPPVNAAIARALPAMYYTALVEGSFLRGAGLRELWGNLAALVVIGAGILTLGHALLHKRTRS